MGFNEVSWTSWCSDGAMERRGGFSEHKSLQEIDVQMFLEILLANHLHVVALDCLWKLSVAQSSGMEQWHPVGPVLPHCLFSVSYCATNTSPGGETMKLGNPLSKKRKPGHQPCKSKVLSLTGNSCKPQKVLFLSSKGKNTCVFIRKILIVILTIFCLHYPS